MLRGMAKRTNFLPSVTFIVDNVHLHNLPCSWLQVLCFLFLECWAYAVGVLESTEAASKV